MAKLTLEVYLSYSQVCIFNSSLTQPFNDWSERNFSQGFSWRSGSVSFRGLIEEAQHKINLYLNESIPEIDASVVRAFTVPFEITDGNIEVASISDSCPLELPVGSYSLQIEFLETNDAETPEVNLRLNEGSSRFCIMKADQEIVVEGDLDLNAQPAS